MRLVDELFKSFEKENNKGLPLGNVTSQLFSNIYLNELDQFVKHKLKLKYYFRYCDDFVIVYQDKKFLFEVMERIRSFLHEDLLLDLHPKKVEIRPLRRGIDFLGYVILTHMIILRTKTKKRIIKKIKILRKKLIGRDIYKEKFRSILTSYIGVLSHCRNGKVKSYIKRFLK